MIEVLFVVVVDCFLSLY